MCLNNTPERVVWRYSYGDMMVTIGTLPVEHCFASTRSLCESFLSFCISGCLGQDKPPLPRADHLNLNITGGSTHSTEYFEWPPCSDRDIRIIVVEWLR